jgi:hypothetical protein
MECSVSWWKWFVLSIFCEPFVLFFIGKKLHISVPAYRFLFFGISLYALRVGLNIRADNLIDLLELDEPEIIQKDDIKIG